MFKKQRFVWFLTWIVLNNDFGTISGFTGSATSIFNRNLCKYINDGFWSKIMSWHVIWATLRFYFRSEVQSEFENMSIRKLIVNSSDSENFLAIRAKNNKNRTYVFFYSGFSDWWSVKVSAKNVSKKYHFSSILNFEPF